MTLELVTECGGNSFLSEEGNAVLITPIADGEYLVSEHIIGNYPAWGVYTIKMSEDNVINHIQEYYGGWTATKCNVNINISLCNEVFGIDDLIEMISDEVYLDADENDYVLNDDTLIPTIYKVAKNKKLYLTVQTVNTIEQYIIEENLG